MRLIKYLCIGFGCCAKPVVYKYAFTSTPGRTPLWPTCTYTNDLLTLKWDHPDQDAPPKEYQIQYEPLEDEDPDPIPVHENQEVYPKSISLKGNIKEKRIDKLMPGMKYCFRLRAQNLAGWGLWSSPTIGLAPNFPLEIGYTGEIVRVQIPCNGLYAITARGAKAADGESCKGGRGAIVEAKFYLNK